MPTPAPTAVPAVFSEEFFTQPWPTYRWLQAHEPVHWSDIAHAWVVSRYSDVRRVLADQESFSSQNIAPIMQRLPNEARERCGFLERYRSSWMINRDEPGHQRLRRAVQHQFTRRAIEPLRAEIERISARLLDQLRYPHEVHIEIIGRYAFPLPATVLTRLIGQPGMDMETIKIWTDEQALIFGTPQPTAAIAERSHAATEAMHDYLHFMATQPAKNGLLRTVLRAQDDGKLDEFEALSTIGLMAFAGHETTTNLIANGLLALLRHPDQADLFREADHDARRPMVEELLRYDPPVTAPARIARREITLHGRAIHAGDRVLPLIAAANRDPDIFPDPDRLDLTRQPRGVLAFGYGPHLCLGAWLARMEAAIAISRLLQRHPNIRVDEERLQGYKPLTQFRALWCLPVQIH